MYFDRANKPKHLFSFQKLNKYFLFPFLIPIICFITKFFSETMKTDSNRININDVTADNVHTFVFLYQIIQSICLIFGGLLYFISAYYSKSHKQKLSKVETCFSSNNTVKSILNSQSKNKNHKYCMQTKNLIVIFMPFLLINYNLGIAYGVKHPQLEKRVYFLFFITLINIFAFKKQIFRHQKLALIIAAIGIIPVFIAFGLYLNLEEYSLFYDLFLFGGSFCYSLYLVLIKYLTLNKQMDVFLLLLYQGLFCFIYTIIIFAIISLIIKGNFSYIYNIFYCNETNYICVSHFYFKIIMFFLLNIVLQTLMFLVIYFFSPELFAISDIFSPLFSFIALCIETNETNIIKIILTVSGYLIIGIASFIYNEIIVCNFCGLNENTWKAIDLKAHEDLLRIDSINSYADIQNYKIESETPIKDESGIEMIGQY